MLEKEVKILEVDVNALTKKLIELGATQTFEWVIHDVYYDFPWEKMETSKRIFRVRKKWETHLYTIKKKRSGKDKWAEKGIKIADEWEYSITDVESFSKVLERYGMEKIREKKKHRISYKIWEVEFDIDDYDGIPPLLEIEAPRSEQIEEYVKKLSLDKHIIKTFGSRWLFRYYWLDYSYF